MLVGEAADGGVGEGEAGAVVVGEGSLVEGVGEDEVVVFFLDEGWEVGFFAEFLVLGFGEGADEGEGGGAGDAGLRVGFLEEGAEGVRCNLLVEDEDVFCGAGEGGGLGGGGELVGGEGPGDLVGGAEGFLEPAGGGEAGGGDDEVEAVFGGAGVVGEVGVEAVEAEVVEACGVEGAAEGLGGGAGREVEGGGAEDADGAAEVAEVVRGRGQAGALRRLAQRRIFPRDAAGARWGLGGVVFQGGFVVFFGAARMFTASLAVAKPPPSRRWAGLRGGGRSEGAEVVASLLVRLGGNTEF